MTLESQYKEFISNNPNYSHWTYLEWLKYHSNQIAEIIEQIKEKDRIWLDKQE